MIYSIRAIVSQFSAMVTIMQRVIKRRKVVRSNAKARRCPPSVPRLISIDYWCYPWGQLLRRFAAIDGGPSIASRDGKLFRRRFRVPYCVYRNLVQKCYDKNLFGENSSKEKDVTGVVGPAIPGLRAVPDLVPIHPILLPTVHIHL